MKREELKQIKDKLKSVCKEITFLSNADLKTPKDIENFKKRLENLYPEILYKNLDQWKANTLDSFKTILKERREKFNSYVTSFINSLRSENIKIREFQDAWRINQFKIYFKTENTSLKITYNEQTILNWAIISSADDIKKYYIQTCKLLENNTLPIDFLTELFSSSYDHAISINKNENNYNTPGVPIKDFHLETQVEFFRKSLLSKKIKFRELPAWSFLYNLDRYISNKDIPYNEKISIVSGSQFETQKGMGMIVNGLHPLTDYKTVCYVKKGVN